jgi:hypothetical protein
MAFRPFQNVRASDVLFEKPRQIANEIELLDNVYVLNTSPTELENYYTKKLLISPLIVDYDDKRMVGDPKSVQVNVSNNRLASRMASRMGVTRVPGTELVIAIPFHGDPELWKYHPSTFRAAVYPDINVENGRITFALHFTDSNPDPAQIENQLNTYISSMKSATDYLKTEIDAYNKANESVVKPWIDAKRNKALAAHKIPSTLGLKVEKRGEPLTYALPVQRKQITVSRPVPATAAFQPEPAINDKVYREIVDCLWNMSRTMEQMPGAFAALGEEDIRAFFLVNLNGTFQCKATGETFNKIGKTDIHIQDEGKSLFIAECKFWEGEKGFNATLDQLLKYLTWRDCKTALVIFNRRKNTTAVAEKMHEVMEGRKERKKTVSHALDAPSYYTLVRDQEPGREIQVATLLFNIPSD